MGEVDAKPGDLRFRSDDLYEIHLAANPARNKPQSRLARHSRRLFPVLLSPPPASVLCPLSFDT